MKEQIIIEGGKKLSGKIRISGSKNAALPIMAATILSGKDVTLSNIPHLTDISTMLHLLLSLGAKISAKGHGSENNARGRSFVIAAQHINNTKAEYDIVSKMRASILVLGPLLARFKKATVSLPGGCAIGARPVDLHLMALEQLGASFEFKNGYIKAQAPQGLIGGVVNFPKISVGATENIVMAATLAKGKTIINNAAIEPEVIDLIKFLRQMGADITVHNRVITVVGQESLGVADYEISPDRIEAGSYAVAAIITKGEVELTKVTSDILDPIKSYLEICGAILEYNEDNIKISYKAKPAQQKLQIETAPYPEFPTDMQAQLAALLSLQEFSSVITEDIFENRFMHVPELNRIGANIQISANQIFISPCKEFVGTEVSATDLRASMTLVIAALAAKGTTVINNVYHLDRGYEALEEKLFKCGATIWRKYS